MAAPNAPRRGSLQYWPRKRASRFLPSVNWEAIDSDKPLKGFLVYKAGMASALVKDNTEFSMTKGKNVAVPITILECPTMKIFSIRFYKHGKVAKEEVIANDKELKRRVKLPKQAKKIEDINHHDYDDIRVIVYSNVKTTGIKKAPDMLEIGLTGSKEEKLNFAKHHANKEISILDFFKKGDLADLRGLTKGKGFQGTIKRYGLTLKFHKSEKGQRRPGNLAPWHPARTTYMSPQAGQMGLYTRVSYNNKIVDLGKAEGKFKNIKNYGDVKTNYILVTGSVQGPAKRQLIITAPLRKTRKQERKNYDLLEVLR
jgi:large subunit ribosomal protein L3